MGLLKRVLEGAACRHSSRRSRSGITTVRKDAGGNYGHIESCAECRSRQQRERQYLARLHGAAVPEASGDLTARLLARTEQLAAERSATDPPWPVPGQRPRRRVPALMAGAAAAAVSLMAGAAYLTGGQAAPLADGADASVFSRQEAPASLIGRPDFTPAGALSAEQLAALRSRGWTCPELRELGFRVVWAQNGVVAGEEILELRLTDGRHFATVLEQHGAVLPQHDPAAAQQPAPVNVLTGHPATADGFTASELKGAAGTPVARSGTVWVNTAGPYTAIYQTPTATFTYVSDLPAGQADDGVAALVQAPAGTPAAEGIAERMERGLGRILKLLAP
ncbi:MAG: anti-sigma factor [Arthrobacter sp.]|nr:anti-sigma factor [Arthrobacter sp.]